MTSSDRPQILSYGGGLDSFGMLVDAIHRGEPPDVCVFADVADPAHEDPGEWPGTYRHIEEVVKPLCRAHAIGFETLDTVRYPVRDARSLFAWMEARGQIPVTGPTRICTIVAKVERFERWLDEHHPDQDVEVWVGFEAGEESRAAYDPNAGRKRAAKLGQARRHNRYPLIERGLCRCRCEDLVEALGYDVPRKSACSFCGYNTRGDWQTFARELPHHFARTQELEANKPPTKAGRKLSIAGYRSRPDGTYVAPPLAEFIAQPYRPKKIPCPVCGRAERATKAVGCDWVVEAEGAAASAPTEPAWSGAFARRGRAALPEPRWRGAFGPAPTPTAAVVIVPSGPLFAAIQSHKHSGAVCFPGGKIEPGETATAAAGRELGEETGLELTGPLVELGTQDDGEHVSALFLAPSWRGTLRSSREGEAFWARPEDLTGPSSAFPTYNRWALQRLREAA